MKHLLFAVYDSAAKAFNLPFPAQTIEMAIREFRQAVNREGRFNDYPEDYTLFHVGEFDQEKGLLVPLATPVNLGVAVMYLNADARRVPEPIQEVSNG